MRINFYFHYATERIIRLSVHRFYTILELIHRGGRDLFYYLLILLLLLFLTYL